MVDNNKKKNIMAKMKGLIWLTIATSLLMMGGCNSSDNNLKNCEDYVYVDSLSSTHVYGYVRDIDGNALENVLVTTGQDTTFTSGSGSYSFEQCRVVNGRSIVKFENQEYFSVVRTADIVDGEARVDAILMPQDSREGVTEVARFDNNEGATIKVGNMQVVLPANSLVYEKDEKEFNGSVFASVYYLNPNSETFVKEMPGGNMSGVTSEGKDVILLSYGMVEVTLKDSVGQKLQLKKGAESTLTFPVPDGFKEEQKYEKIPLWYFDEEKGTWVEEGMATKNGDTYTGNVKHFSWYNLDWPELRATIVGRVTNKDGKPLPNILVTISQTSAYSDSAGYYRAFVPRNTPFFVTVKSEDYAGYSNCPFFNIDGLEAQSVYTQDIVLPNMPCAHGKVLDKGGQPICGVEICADKFTACTNRKGEYFMYCNAPNPFSLKVSEKTVLNQKEYEKYDFINSWVIDPDASYDFVMDRPIGVYGSVCFSDYKRLKKPVTITVVIDQKEYRVSSKGWYAFGISPDVQEIYAYVKAEDGCGVESNKVSKKISQYRMIWMPSIYIPNGFDISGFVVNTCGPSKAKVTIEVGKGKNKMTFSQNTKYGYFNIDLPISVKGSKAKVKIDCCGKRFTKKIDKIDSNLYLGRMEVCLGEKPDPDCIYAIVGDKTVKFNTKKDKFTEMFQSKGSGTRKYQVWYKSPDYDGMLILENNYNEYSISGPRHTLCVYLLTDMMNVAKSKGTDARADKDSLFTFKTDCELYVDSEDDDEIYLYGSAAIKNKNIRDVEIYKNYPCSKSANVLVGSSNSTEFMTLTVPKESTKNIENLLKNKGLKDKTTYMDDEQRITSIYLHDDAQAIIHRNKDNTSNATILVRGGIGKEPLFKCWKVDFRNSSLKKKGDSNINYMWKNEADIAQLIMFGPIMGVKFTETDIEEEKCGCTTGNAPSVVAGK